MLSHSSKTLWLECQQKWKFRYIDRVETVDTAEPLEAGKAVHEALEHHDPERIVNYADLPVDLRACLIALASNYRLAHQPDPTPLEHEIEMKVDIGDGVVCIIVLDGLGVDEQGQEFFRESKTTRADVSIGSPYWEKVHAINPQADLYFAALRLAGRNPAYCQWDAMRIPALRRLRATPMDKREFYKRETGTSKVGDPKPGTFLTDESFADFTSRVQRTITADMGKYYRREIVVPNEAAIAKVLLQLKLVGVGIRGAAQSGCYLENTNACFSRRDPCEFVPVCSGQTTLADKQLYKIRDKREAIKPAF